jgi:hypothetical protein
MKYLILCIVIIVVVYLLYFRNKDIESFSESVGYKHMGCYNDSSNRALPSYLGSNFNAASCATAAANKGYKYFGLQDPQSSGSQCFAGNSLSKATEYGSTSCGKTGGIWKNYVYSVGETHGSAVAMGTPGIGPWGNCPGFLDQNAQWIWYINGQSSVPGNGSKTWVNTSPPPKSSPTFYYNWYNDTGENITAKLNIIADNASQVWVNTKYKGTQYAGYGGSGGIYNITLTPGINNFQFRAQNFGSGKNPAGLLVTVVYSSNNQVIFSSSSEWKFIITTSSTDYTPMSIPAKYQLDYSNYCSGQSNGPVYLNSEKSTIINSDSNGVLREGINDCLNNNECHMVLASGVNKYNTYKDIQNVFMFCNRQNIPPAKNRGVYFLTNPKQITIGTSDEKTKIVDLPEKDMIVSPMPANPQHYTWADVFDVKVVCNQAYVTINTGQTGWGQNLILNAYSTSNIAIKPQPADSYVPLSSYETNYYNNNGSFGGTIPMVQANFSGQTTQKVNKWINYEDLPEDIVYLQAKPKNDDTVSCRDRGLSIVDKHNKDAYLNIGWGVPPFMCNNNKDNGVYDVQGATNCVKPVVIKTQSEKKNAEKSVPQPKF